MNPVKAVRKLINNIQEIRDDTCEAKDNALGVNNKIAEVNCKLDNVLEVLALRRAGIENSKYGIYSRMGFELILDKSSLVDKTIIEQGSWEIEQVGFISDLIKRVSDKSDCYFLDIGAYWGLYSMVALRAGVSNIIAFEADKNNYAQFRAQQFLNGTIDSIQCRNLAVSDKKGVARFWDSKKHPGGNRAGVGIVGPLHDYDTYEVETVSIDECLNLSDKLIFAKLDVEGNETRVLAGMQETISSNRVVLQIEMLPDEERATTQAVKSLNLRKIGEIHLDHYYTNLSAAEIDP